MAITFPTDPVEGQTFTDNNVVYRYSASRGYWTTISLSSITLTQLQRESFVATEGQTVHTFNYDPGAEIQVVMNGIILRETDYTATNGTSITFTEAFVAGDQVDIFFYPVAVVAAPTSINDLTDVTITSATANDTLMYNGSQWINQPAASSGESIFLTATLNSSDWTRAQATLSDPWIATKTVPGILSTDRPIVDIDLSSVSLSNVHTVETSWSNLYRVEASADNEIKFYATNQPTINFNLLITGVR
jgi:hypothetical protein